MSVTVNMDEVFAGLDALQEHLENPKPVLRAWARKSYIPAVKATLAAGGKGSRPYAESTLKRLESAGTSQISARGTIRSDRIKRAVGALKRNAKALERDGWSPDWQKKQDRLERRLRGFERAEAKAATKTGKRNIGKRQIEKNHHPLEKMGKTIRASIKDDSLQIYSATEDLGAAHDEGAGPGGGKKSTTPDRPYIITPDFDQQLTTLAEMLQTDLVEAFDG